MKATNETLTVDTLIADPLQYKKAMENHSVAFILGIKGTTIYGNDAAAQLFGYTREEFIKIHRDQLFLNNEAYHQALEKRSQGISHVGELTAVRKNGTTFPCDVHSAFFQDVDGVVKTSTAIIDLSARKKLESEIRLSEMLLNHIDQSVILVNRDLSIVNFTRSAREELKRLRHVDIAIGDCILKIAPEERKLALQDQFDMAFAGHTPIYHTQYFADGKPVFFESKFKPIINEQGLIDSVLLTATNITDKRLAKNALEEAEQRWRFALEGSNQGVWDWDIQSGYCYYSLTWKKLLGFEEHDELNHISDWKKLLHPDDLLKMEREIESHLARQNRSHETVHRLRRKDGEYRWILARGMIVSYDAENRPLRMIGTHTDITDQKNIQQGYQHLFYNHPLPMWIYETGSLKIAEVNEAALLQYGYSRNEFLALTIKQLRPDEDIEILFDLINRINPDETAKYVVRHKRKDGSIIYVEVVGNHIEYNGKRCRMISANDISATIATEQELRNSNERFELAGRATSDAIWDWDLANNTIHWGKSLFTLFGYRNDINIEAWIDAIHPEDRFRVEHGIESTLHDSFRNHWSEEYRFMDARGNYRYVLDRGFIVRGEHQKPMRMIGAMQDITDRKLKEQELEQSNERFMMASRATSDVVWDWNLENGLIELTENYTITFGHQIPQSKKISLLSFEQHIHPDDHTNWHSRINAALLNSKTVKFEEEFRLRRFDGSYAFVVARGYIIRNDLGKSTRVIGAISDISEKKYHQELLALELRVFETSSIPNISFTNVLRTFLQGFEYLHPDLHAALVVPGPSQMALITTKNPDHSDGAIRSAIELQNQGGYSKVSGKKQLIVSDLSGTEWEACSSYFQKHNWKICWIIPIRHSGDSEIAYFTLFLTESKTPSESQLNMLLRLRNLLRILLINYRSLKQVQESNERYNMVLKATHDMIWDWNLEKGSLYRNEDGVSKVYGMADSACIQNIEDWMKRIHKDDQEHVATVIRSILDSVEMDHFEIEYRFKRDDGQFSYVYDRGIVIKNESGKPVRLIGAAQNISERKKLEEELVKKEVERQKAINQASIDSQEQERREIGKELHDNVNQILTTTRLYLDLSLSNQEMKDELILKSSKNINYVINEIRQLSRSLMDPSLGDLGLIDSLNDLIESINITKKLSVSLRADCHLDNHIGSNQKLTVFRIVQEALNNVIRHADASNVVVELKRRKEVVELTIRDDGKGFDLQTVRRGAGVKNIQNRVYLMSGKVQIEAAPEKGCSINIQFPINQTN